MKISMKKNHKKTTSNQNKNAQKRRRKTKKGSTPKHLQRQQKDKENKRIILGFLSSHKNDAFTCKEIAAQTGLWHNMSNNKLRAFLDRLTQEGKVEYLDKGKYRYLPAARAQTLTGQVEVTRSGMGFLLMEEGDDIIIPPNALGKALNGDTVKVRILRKRKKEGRKEGKVLEVVKRARTEFVGTIEEGLPGRFFFTPDDNQIKTDFRISKSKVNGAKDGDKVLVRLLKWEGRIPEAEVVEVLGKSGTHQAEMHAILLKYGFQPAFPEAVEREAASISEEISKKEIAKRRDMRQVPTFTIDPEDAKDFDDALSLRPLENGHYEVGIHIADVSYYVKKGSLIDQEGYKRATSVYLVDRTVPMLPEKLSNRLCSLRPNEDKLTFSAIFELDLQGKIYKQWFGRTLIHSDYRFHYAEAQQVIDGKLKHPMKQQLLLLNQMAKNLRSHRMGTGSIEFETDEVRFELDENDKPVRVIKKERLDAHKLIEDFMLLANRRVAEFVATMFDKDMPPPFVYRIHDKPDPEKLAKLSVFAAHFGYKLKLDDVDYTAEQLNRLLLDVQGKPEQNVIESIAIRSMAKAIYSIHNIGHFGLGFRYYTHFTSPIRRYPDLMVHRLVEQYLHKSFKANPVLLEEACQHCSRMERTATEAERASIKYKQVEFLQDKIGQQFEGIISGVIENGFFVELADNLCEGYVPVHSLNDDYYTFEAENYCLRGKDTGNILQLGDKVLVEVAETNLQKRQIEFILIQRLETKAAKRAAR